MNIESLPYFTLHSFIAHGLFIIMLIVLIGSCVFADINTTPAAHRKGRGMHVALVIMISVLVSTVLLVGLVAAYKYWQKKKREHEQARFLKLFEDGDDIEDELGLGTVI